MNLFRRLVSSTIIWKLFNRIIWKPALIFRKHRYDVIEKRILNRFNTPAMVIDGPFCGMQYPFLKSCCSTLIPKLIGTYESELHPYFRRWRDVDFSKIIDIGSAEGYYAIGLARMFPNAAIIAYDASDEARSLTSELAAANGEHSRITIRGGCSREMLLTEKNNARTLIVCDCEGCEQNIFDSEVAYHLRSCHIIIELHDNPQQGSYARSVLLPILAKTHHVEIASSLSDDQKANYYKSDFLTDDPLERQIGFAEKRPFTMEWLVCEPLI